MWVGFLMECYDTQIAWCLAFACYFLYHKICCNILLLVVSHVCLMIICGKVKFFNNLILLQERMSEAFHVQGSIPARAKHRCGYSSFHKYVVMI